MHIDFAQHYKQMEGEAEAKKKASDQLDHALRGWSCADA
jgi:hypothetical protein